MLSPHFSLDSFFRISVAQYNIYGHKSKLLFIMFDESDVSYMRRAYLCM